jgi:hypothetical protein
MKKIKQLIFLGAFLLLIGGCDKGFEDINTNPYAITNMDPALLFAGSERTTKGNGWESESTVIQQFVNPFNQGATVAFNFNENIDGFQNSAWDSYTGSIKTYTHILDMLDGTTTRVNLQSMTRIMKAMVYMSIVDHYGSVPYFDAGNAYIEGTSAFYPAYDNASDIYDDLYLEITDALSKLNIAGDFVSSDLFYGTHAYYPITTASAQVAKWKKFGNSLLLRLGMRYSKLSPSKAETIVKKAFADGVMTSNNDNMFVVYDGTNFTNSGNNGLINNNPYFYYAAEPFVNQLKSTLDPRSKYMVATFADPQKPLNDSKPNTNVATQFGLPVGVLSGNLTVANGYRGTNGNGYNYSQLNVNVAAALTTPSFWMTYAQTSLLLAEAAHRGWLTGSVDEVSAKTYYEAGIKADMDVYTLILTTIKANTTVTTTLSSVSAAEYNAYIAQPLIAYNAADALNLINTQYWIANFLNGTEAWANYRRTGFPALTRNKFNDALLANGGDGYVHRFSYPDAELTKNQVNYQDAVAKLAGSVDDLTNRIFWDTK